ncbi:MAG: permease-like cell division protein FtsX [Candidatus Neomarinimicrobiota bacterium]|nr:permease-like cell division protein FtsX [Candidatus Neomarinimicrobiota bacterium]
MDKLAFLLSEGVKNLWRHKLTSFSSIFSIFLTLIISGSLIIVSQNTSKVIEYLRDKYKIEVFFKNEITFEKVEKVVSNINKINGVRSTTVISKDDAEKIFKSQFGEDIMKIIGYNPLPISCVVNIVKDDTKTINIASIINKLKSFQEIDEINYQGRIISRIEGYYQLFVRLMTSILIIVFFISIFTISNTIRLTIYGKEKLIESLQLIGATRSFVKAPFIIEGILIGFIGSALSSLLLIGLLEFSYDLIYTYLSFEIEYDIKLLILTLCSLSIIISFIGSSRATARFLK